MIAKRRPVALSIIVLASLVYSLTSPLVATADEATPPPPETSEVSADRRSRDRRSSD